MGDQISFFVSGEPVPQGSMQAITLPGQQWTQLIAENAGELNRWRKKVGELAKLAANQAGWTERRQEAIHLTCRFFLPMPKTRPASIRKQKIALCGVKPDLDKLVRAIGDALTEYHVLFDDSRIVKGGQVKYEVVDHELCGAEVVLRMIDLVAEREMMFEALERRQKHRPLPHHHQR